MLDRRVMHVGHGVCEQCGLHKNLEQVGELNDRLNNAYSILGVGLIFFDGQKNVTHVNIQAKKRLKLPEDFIEQGRDLINNCFTKSDQTRLRSSISLLHDSDSSSEVFVNVTVSGESSVVMLERLEHTAFDMVDSGVAMFIFDSRRNIEVSSGGVARIFGLTKAEARLTVAIVNGMTAAEYSAANGISIHTAYSQIKGILAKTGARRQAELVRLVLEYSPSFRRLDRHQLIEIMPEESK